MTNQDVIKPLKDYVQKQVDYYSNIGIKTQIEIGKETAYKDVLDKIKKFEWNGTV